MRQNASQTRWEAARKVLCISLIERKVRPTSNKRNYDAIHNTRKAFALCDQFGSIHKLKAGFDRKLGLALPPPDTVNSCQQRMRLVYKVSKSAGPDETQPEVQGLQDDFLSWQTSTAQLKW